VTVSSSGAARAFISLGTTRKTEELEALNAAPSDVGPARTPIAQPSLYKSLKAMRPGPIGLLARRALDEYRAPTPKTLI
jgi:hypothetical protein